MKSLRYALILLLLIFISRSDGVRVCTTWHDYLNPLSKNCFDDPDGEPSNVTQILQRWGCTVDEFQLLTEDGYYILVLRAIMGSVRQKTPILIGHGMFMNSLGFVVMYKKSTVSIKLHKFDIPAVMDLVSKETDGSKAIFIGYSIAATAINTYCILYQEEANRRLKGIIELAPVANLTDMRSTLRIVSPLWPIVKPLANSISHGRLLPRNRMSSEFCSSNLLGIFLCATMVDLDFGMNYQMMDPLRQPVVFQQTPDVVSVMIIDHYYQILRSNQFQQYDYGFEENMKKYGSPSPPIYDISKISVPVTLYVGLNDYLAEAKNARKLYSNIPRGSRCGFKIMPDPDWTHLSFIMSKDMPLYLNKDVLNTIAIMESNSCKSISLQETVPTSFDRSIF